MSRRNDAKQDLATPENDEIKAIIGQKSKHYVSALIYNTVK